MELKKIWLYLSVLILSTVPSFAVSVVQTVESNKESISEGFGTFLATIIIFSLIGIAVLTLLFWVIFTFYRKFSSMFNRSKDFMYREFERNLRHCFINRDTTLIKRNWRLFWLFFKRENVYCDTSKGLKAVGKYNGEGYKKENFYIISLYNKAGLFKVAQSIIIIPLKIKERLVKKITVSGKSVIVLDCEGLDNFASTDYFFFPLIKDDKNKFVDFADYIHKNYIENVVHRDIINQNLQSYRKGVISSVESNPNVHFKRRGE